MILLQSINYAHLFFFFKYISRKKKELRNPYCVFAEGDGIARHRQGKSFSVSLSRDTRKKKKNLRVVL